MQTQQQIESTLRRAEIAARSLERLPGRGAI